MLESIYFWQSEGPTVRLQSDALEESDLWTAWQLFPLDDD